MKPSLRIHPVPGFLLAALLLTGCLLGEDEAPQTPLRSYEKGVYTDHELGYRIAFPPDWHVTAPTGYEGFDLSGLGFSPGAKYPPQVLIWRDSLDGETLRQEIEWRHKPEYAFLDSAVIRPAQMRGGVEVTPVDRWDYMTYFTQKTRILYFERQGHMVRIQLTQVSANFDTCSQLRFVDSSLTFF